MREALERLAGPGSVTEAPVEDLWPRHLLRARSGQGPPSVLSVRPSTYEGVQAVVRWALETRTVIVPAGGLSGVCGAIELGAGQVALDLRGLDRILELDEPNLTCTVQAGILGSALESVLEGRGLTLGHFPSSLPVATVGGLVSTRSSGQMSTYYGNIEDLLLGVTAVLPDGTLLDRHRPGPRSAIGPALHQLFVGAEGGLGIVLDATLRISRRPESTIGRGYRFETLGEGLAVMRLTLQSGLRPLVMRLYDPEDTQFQGQELGGGCLLVVAAAGPEPTARAAMEVVASQCRAARDLGPAPWERWLDHRYGLSAERLREVMEAPGMIADTIELAAPWTEVEALHGEVKAVLGGGQRLALCHFSHASAQGCCAYFTFAGRCSGEAEAETVYREVWEAAMEAALRRRATLSHHHGAGQSRAPWIRAELGGWADTWELVRRAFDPGRLMNPNAVGGGRG